MSQLSRVHSVDIQNIEPLAPGRYVLPDWEPLREMYFDSNGESLRRYSSSRFVRDIVCERYVSGDLRGLSLSSYIGDSMGLFISESLWASPNAEVVFSGQDWCLLTFRLEGNSIESSDGETYRVGPSSCSMAHLTKGADYTFRLASENLLTEISVIFRISSLTQKLNLDAKLLTTFSHFPMTSEMELVLQALFAYNSSSPTYHLFTEAKAMELIALYVAGLIDQTQSASLTSASPRALQQYTAAKQYLDRHFCNPPTIETLSRIVGLNRRQLNEGFKATFGSTIYQYTQSLRMEKAKALFRSQQTNISWVANRLGYRYQSNFSKAFQRYVGMGPKEYVNLQKTGKP